MVISFVSQGTTPTAAATGTGTTSVTPALPATIATNDIVFIYVGNKPDTSSPTTPTGWTLAGTIAGGAGAVGADTGPVRTTVFYRIKDASWSTMPAITVAGNSAAIAQAFVYRNSTGLWSVAASGGADTTTGAAWSVTTASDPGFGGGDWALVYSTIPTDVTTPAQFTAEAITATGIAWGTMTERSEPETTSGNQVAGFVFDRPASSGVSTAAPVVTATAATTNTNVAGTSLVVRLRESPAITFPQPDAASPATYTNSTTANAVSPTFTPPANSTIIVGYTSDGAQSSASIITNSAGLTFTLYAQRYLSVPAGNTDHGHVALWATHIGVSPGPMTITVNNGEGTALNKMLIVKVYLDADVDPVTPIGTISDGAFASGATLSASLTPQTTGGGIRMLWLDWNATGIPTSFLPNNTQTVLVDAVQSAGNSTNVQIAKTVPTTAGVAETIGATLLASSTDGNYIAYELRAPSAATTPASASDTGAVSVAETITIASITNTADTGAVSIAESRTLNSTSTSAESNSLSAGDVSNVLVLVSTSDTGAVSVADVSSIANSVSATDTGVISIAETMTISSTTATTDTGAVSIADVSTVAKSSSTTDGGSIAAADSSSVLVTVNTTDTGSVSIADSASPSVSISTTDTGSISVTESQTSTSSLSVSESNSLAAGDVSASFRTFDVSDSAAFTITEISNVGSTVPGTEQIAVGVAEQAVVIVIVNTSDAGAVSVAETQTSASFLNTSDTTAVSIAESRTQAVSVSTSESNALGIDETTAQFNALSTTDAASVSIAETNGFFRALAATDTTAVSIADVSAAEQDFPGAETNSIAVAEVADVQVIGVIDKPTSDTGSVSVAESRNVTVVVTATDASAVSVAESRASALFVVAGDTASISGAEQAVLFRPITATDTTAVSASDVSAVVAVSPGTDTTAVGVTETSSIQIIGTITKSAADSGSISASETSSAFVIISRTENPAVSVVESSTSDLTTSKSDTGAISAAESIELTVTRAAFDSINVSVSETSDVLAQAGLVNITAEDEAAISVSEFKKVYKPGVSSDFVHISTSTSTQTYFAVELDTGTIVSDSTAETQRLEGDSEENQRIE